MAWESMEPLDRLTVIQEQAHKIKGEAAVRSTGLKEMGDRLAVAFDSFEQPMRILFAPVVPIAGIMTVTSAHFPQKSLYSGTSERTDGILPRTIICNQNRVNWASREFQHPLQHPQSR
jgi:hypothetical protein